MIENIDNNEPERAYILTNAVLFAQNVCRSIQDMTGINFNPAMDSLAFSSNENIKGLTVYSPFLGKISGQFAVTLNEKTSSALSNTLDNEPNAELHFKISGDFLKEMLNVAVGHSIVELESKFGALSHIPPTLVIGLVEFPQVHTGTINLVSDVGTVSCSLSLNLVDLRIGRKLEEAQWKLNKVFETHSAMLIQPSETPDARFSVYYKTVDEAGGDLYDVIEISDGIYGYFVGDVSGHDIGKGFLTASVRALLRQNCTNHFTPVESMRNVNNVLCQLLSNFEYVTACYAVLNRKDHYLTVVNMGHPPLLFTPVHGDIRLIESEGEMLGVFRNCSLESVCVQVKTGDRFFLYTDGLIENDGTRVWSAGSESLVSLGPLLRSVTLEKSALTLVEAMLPGQSSFKDDVVVLGVEV